MSNLKTNSKTVKNLVKQYILESVHDENELQFKTFEESAKELMYEFNRVANYQNNLKAIPNDEMRFIDFLNGYAPYWFPCYTDDKKDFLNSLGINENKKEYSSDKIEKLFGHLIYTEIKNF